MHPYASLQYARTLAHLGRPIHVGPWNTHLISRNYGKDVADAVGPYPLTPLLPDCDLGGGIATLRNAGFLTVTLVVDGVTSPSIEDLSKHFTLVRPFKRHYWFDRGAGEYAPTKHHRYEIRRASRQGVTVRTMQLAAILDNWTALYQGLIARHEISGFQHFDRSAFEILSTCDGLEAIAAYVGDELVSCHLWFKYGSHVWSHLAASNERGYATSASYAVCDFSLRHFEDLAIDLGGSAGTSSQSHDGLSRFKAGFGNVERTSYLCGAILDNKRYDSLCQKMGATTEEDYFPAYRRPM